MTDEQKKTQLIKQPSLGATDLRSIQDMGLEDYNGPPQICNFDIQSPSGMRRFMSAAGDTQLAASDTDGEVFRLKWWMAEPASFRNDETGDIVTGVRVTLWDDAERRLTAASWVIARYLDRIVKAMGPGPYDPPIGLLFENKVRRDGKRSYLVEMVELPPDTPDEIMEA